MGSAVSSTSANLPPGIPVTRAGSVAGNTTGNGGAVIAAGTSLLDDPRPATGRAGPDPEPLRSMLAMLSRRELQIARLVTRGMTNRQIAVHLHIALGTVTSHLKHIFSKLEVNSRTQLAGWIAAAHAVGVPEEP